MSGGQVISSAELMRAEKRVAAGTSVLAAVVITALKIVVGLLPAASAFFRKPPTPVWT